MTAHIIISDSALIHAHAGDTFDFVGIGDPSFAELWAGGGNETLIASGSSAAFHGGTGHTRMIGNAASNVFFDSHGHNDFVLSGDEFSFVYGFHRGDRLIVPTGTVAEYDALTHEEHLSINGGGLFATIYAPHHILHGHDFMYI